MQKTTIPRETIDAWKKQHGTVHKLSVIVTKDKDDKEKDDVAVGYIKDINENIDLIANVLSLQNQTKVIEAKVLLLENAWLGGDERMCGQNAVNSVKLGAATQAGRTLEVLTGSVEKL